MRKRIEIIVNPAAGGHRNGLFGDVMRLLAEAGAAVRCHHTTHAGHATALAASLAGEGADVIVAAGGDGTINEVAKGLHGTGLPSSPIMGVLPLGTANVLAIEMGQRLKPADIADTLLRGEARLINTGRANGDLFLLMVGIGFDGEVVGNIQPDMKRKLGKLVFVWEGLKAWFRGPAAQLSVSIDGAAHDASWVIVTNARHYAGPFVITRETDVLQPGLDVVLLQSPSRLAFALFFLGLGLGCVHAMPWVRRLPAVAVTVETVGDHPVRVEVDGDAKAEIVNGALAIRQGDEMLRLVVPRDQASARQVRVSAGPGLHE